MPHGFFEDINGDKCQRTLAGAIIGVLWLIMGTVSLLYGLAHEIKSPAVIDSIMYSFGLASTGLLGITIFQKPKSNNE